MQSRRGLYLVAVAISYVLATSASLATCRITKGSGPAELTFSIPPLTVNSDAEPGTLLYSNALTHSQIGVTCDAPGEIWQGYNGGITEADKNTSVSQSGVYNTTIPGIGFRAAWVNSTNVTFSDGSIITPWHIGSSRVTQRDGEYLITLSASIQFIVTGAIKSGLIDTRRFVADWKYDNLIIGKLRFSSVVVNVEANACSLVEKNITVPLKDMLVSDFSAGLSPVASDDRFKIVLDNCAPGVKVDYQLTSSGSTGVSRNGSVLDIASGAGAASGVGLEILDRQNAIVTFDTHYTAVSNTTQGERIEVPLKARYVQTGDIKAGKVNAIATFEIYYR